MLYVGGYDQRGLAMAQTPHLGGTTPWSPDESDVANLRPQTGEIDLPPQLSAQHSAISSSYSHIILQTPVLTASSPGMNADPKYTLSPPTTQDTPPAVELVSREGPGVGGGNSGGLGETDIDRIAARVASFIVHNQGLQPVGTQVFDSPPTYHEKNGGGV